MAAAERETYRDLLAQAPDPLVCVDEEAAAHVEARDLRRRIRCLLPARERCVLALHYGLAGEEFGFRAIATTLGISVGTAHAIERRGLERLRSAYGCAEREAHPRVKGVRP